MRRILQIFVVLVCLVGSVSAYAETIPQSRPQITLSFAPLVKQVTPAVVNIYTQKVVQQRVSPLFDDPFFRQFFMGGMPQGFSRQRLENSLGSGVIVKADGLIVTSNHVIAGADQVRVVLSDRREFDATIVATDEKTDLALLHVDTKGETLPYLELRDADDAQVGDLVIAIGNPFGVGQTVTSGIISAFARRTVGAGDIDYFIQTDAAINPGNSGGALVTMDGRLVGINAAIYSRDGSNLGIGFAVPSNLVRVLMNSVAQGHKSILRPWLGLDGQEVTAEIAASLNMPQPTGVLVNKLSADSPAAKAGIKTGDVIVALNGHAIDDPEAFHYRIAATSVGTDADFTIIRHGQRLQVTVPMISPPETPPRDKTHLTGRSPLSGATIENISPAVREEIDLRYANNGVVIMTVDEDSNAASLGLQPGDILLGINGMKFLSVSDVKSALANPARGWRITVQRGEQTLTIVVGR